MIYSETAPNIWSLSRKYRRNFCPRSAILRYREAPQAAGDRRSLTANRAYACGKKISDEKFLREILLQTMQREFYTGETDPELLTGQLLEAFYAEYRNMLCGRSSRQLFSLCRTPDFENKGRELESKLQNFVKNILPHWETLLAVPPEARRTIARVLDLHINEWRCFGSPLCAYFHSGKLRFVELRSGEFTGAEAETAMLHRIYALNHCGRDPGSVESWLLDYQHGTFRCFNSTNDISEAVNSVKKELNEWKNLWHQPWQSIPGNQVNCPHCVFAELCVDHQI